jgi:mannose-1-phosphate guanylyltransferase
MSRADSTTRLARRLYFFIARHRPDAMCRLRPMDRDMASREEPTTMIDELVALDTSSDEIALDDSLPRELTRRREAGSPTLRHQGLWALVLAGGEGVRLRPLVRRVFGDDRPKQYAPLLGPDTLLTQTLNRVGLEVPAERTVVVTMAQHAGYIADELGRRPRPQVIAQPCDRGTVAATLYPVHRIARVDPDATVAVFPSDHLVVAEAPFMKHVAEVARWVDRHPQWTVLLGAQPTCPEVEYGWIEPAAYLDELGGGPIRAVRAFREKPSVAAATAYLADGHLWNTSVIVARAAALVDLGRAHLPDVHDRLARIQEFEGTPDEPAAIRQAYELLPKANFSRSILEASAADLAVSRLPRVGWSDLGSPRRVMEAIGQLSLPPAWATGLIDALRRGDGGPGACDARILRADP